MSKALDDISAERQRQIKEEGFSVRHDDRHGRGELVRAAVNYAAAASVGIYLGRTHDNVEPPPFRDYGQSIRWPWSDDWWKSTTPRRDLVKAAALLVAEIERLDRAEGDAI